MATFPVLKTGAVAQYPLGQSLRFRTTLVEFLDGGSQRYALQGSALRSWSVRLELLDERELAAVRAFALEAVNGPFSFTDPASGQVAHRCILAGETAQALATGESIGQATLLIRETL